jgi:hypothetical protein
LNSEKKGKEEEETSSFLEADVTFSSQVLLYHARNMLDYAVQVPIKAVMFFA